MRQTLSILQTTFNSAYLHIKFDHVCTMESCILHRADRVFPNRCTTKKSYVVKIKHLKKTYSKWSSPFSFGIRVPKTPVTDIKPFPMSLPVVAIGHGEITLSVWHWSYDAKRRGELSDGMQLVGDDRYLNLSLSGLKVIWHDIARPNVLCWLKSVPDFSELIAAYSPF